MRAEAETSILNKYGFHVRPSTQFMELANRFASDITVEAGGLSANGKNIMDLMILGATQGTAIHIVAVGDDAEEAVAALVALVDGRFGNIE